MSKLGRRFAELKPARFSHRWLVCGVATHAQAPATPAPPRVTRPVGNLILTVRAAASEIDERSVREQV
jgi:hypothetical protein